MSDTADGSTASATGALGTRDAFKFCVKELCRDDTQFHAMPLGRFDFSLCELYTSVQSKRSLRSNCNAEANQHCHLDPWL